jgi:protease-4
MWSENRMALRQPRSPVASLALLALLSAATPGCVLITGTFDPFSTTPEPLEEHVVSGKGRQKVLLIDVSNVISSKEQEGALGIKREEATTARVLEELKRARDDDHIRAVVLRINSPGGTVTASDIVFHEIMRFKHERGVPVVAQLLDLATSGAYYVALAADEIVASPTSVTGSVGVVMYGINVAGLMERVGVKDQTLKSGELKDAGSPLRPMTPADTRLLDAILAQMQERFLTTVKERRPGVSEEALRTIADGRVLTADQAMQLGLIDRVGYLDGTVENATRRAGVPEARVIMYRRRREFADNLYSYVPIGAPQVNLVHIDLGSLAQPPQFMYLWLPALD